MCLVYKLEKKKPIKPVEPELNEEVKTVNIMIDVKQVEQVDKFKYLGSVLTNDGKSLSAITERIGMAKTAFTKLKELLIKKFNKDLKKKLVKCLVWPVALYGCETWTLRKAERDKYNRNRKEWRVSVP